MNSGAGKRRRKVKMMQGLSGAFRNVWDVLEEEAGYSGEVLRKQSWVAARAGVSRNSLTRAYAELRKRGMIATRGHAYVVLKPYCSMAGPEAELANKYRRFVSVGSGATDVPPAMASAE